MSNEFIPYGRQCIDEADIAAVVAVLRSRNLTCGPTVQRFEAALAGFVNAQHATVCSSGTAALHLAYAALGLSRGDEIITTPITFAATASVAVNMGVRVRFADVEPDTGNLDPKSVASLVGRQTKAIVAVHLAGLPCDMVALRAIADRNGLFLIDDAAHALGARMNNRMIGSGFSDATTYSFHPVKHLCTGEGGAVVVKDPALKERLDRLRHHGIVKPTDATGEPWQYRVEECGFNYRLTDIQCALGLSQLSKQEQWLGYRRQLAAAYRQKLATRLNGLVTPQAQPRGCESAYHLFPVLINFDDAGVSRGEVMQRLLAQGIGSQVHYIPLPEHPAFACDDGGAERVGARRYYERTLSLPMHCGLEESDIDRIVGALQIALERGGDRALRGVA